MDPKFDSLPLFIQSRDLLGYHTTIPVVWQRRFNPFEESSAGHVWLRRLSAVHAQSSLKAPPIVTLRNRRRRPNPGILCSILGLLHLDTDFIAISFSFFLFPTPLFINLVSFLPLMSRPPITLPSLKFSDRIIRKHRFRISEFPEPAFETTSSMLRYPLGEVGTWRPRSRGSLLRLRTACEWVETDGAWPYTLQHALDERGWDRRESHFLNYSWNIH